MSVVIHMNITEKMRNWSVFHNERSELLQSVMFIVCRALRYIVPFFFSVGVTTNGSKEIHDYVCTQKIRPRGLARHQKYANFLKSK